MKNLVSTLSLGAVLVIAPLAANAVTAKTTIAKPADAAQIKVSGTSFTPQAAESMTVSTNLPSQFTFTTPKYVNDGVQAAINHADAEIGKIRAALTGSGDQDLTNAIYAAIAQQMVEYIKAADTWPTSSSAQVEAVAVYQTAE